LCLSLSHAFHIVERSADETVDMSFQWYHPVGKNKSDKKHENTENINMKKQGGINVSGANNGTVGGWTWGSTISTNSELTGHWAIGRN
jgi:hypothetical protein